MELKELIERVKAATGPDRELDEDIRIHFDPVGSVFYSESKAYTGSIDAALALVERCLPGWTVARMSQGDNRLWTVELREGFLTSYGKVVIQPDHWQGTTLPLAIILALLTALDKKEENK